MNDSNSRLFPASPDSDPTVTTVARALSAALSTGIDRLDAEWLLLHTLGRDPGQRAWLRAHGQDALPHEALAAFRRCCAQRADQVPLAYLTGTRGFHGLDLAVDARVLDPRPDTETLVDWALQVMEGMHHPRVVDLGTGSGAIALALKHHRPDARVLAIDASADALTVAQANAHRLQLAIDFAHGHWCDPLDTGWDLIVSNPPYIAESDPHLPALRHEPLQALTSGPDGLDDIRCIVQQAPRHLCPGGWLLLEHGHDQSGAVAALLNERGFVPVEHRKDLGDHVRCTGGRWPLGANAG